MLTIRDDQRDGMADSSPGTPIVAPCKDNQTWIEIRLVDQNDKPVKGQKYRVRLPDSSIKEGTLDDDGRARFDGILPGQAKITFPDLDAKEWKAK